jgi:glyoxylate reductase
MATRPRIFVTQPVAESALARLRAVASVKVNPDDSRIIPKTALIAAVKKADILFCLLHDKIDKAVVAANPKLRHIAAQSISPSNIDVAEATARGIAVTVVPPVTTEATADLNFGLMLAVARRIAESPGLVRVGQDHRPYRWRRADRQGGRSPGPWLRDARALLDPATQAGSGGARGGPHLRAAR